MPKWPSRAVAARNPSRCVRPVVWATGPPRWVPSISGGTSSEVQRWIRCRSTASMVSLGHTRSVRVSTSRSIRPPPLAQVSISSRGVRGAQLVEQPVERQRLPVHRRPPLVRDVDQVAVVVPLEERDVVLAQQARSARPGRARRPPGTWRSSTCWCRHSGGSSSRPRRTQSGCARTRSESSFTISGSTQRPKSMPSRLASSISGCSPCGPDLRVDRPVAEPGPVVPTTAEPAVVEHEPLDAHLGGGPSQVAQPVEVVVEVGRLPGVDHDRTGAAGPGRVPSGPARAAARSRRRGRSRRTTPSATGWCRSRPRPARPRRARAARPRRAGTRPPASARRTSCGRRSRPRAPPRPRRARSRSRERRPPSAASRRGRCGRAGPRGGGCRCSHGRRWGVRSRHQRPVRSSSSAARAGTGSAARTACSWRSPAPALVTSRRWRTTPSRVSSSSTTTAQPASGSEPSRRTLASSPSVDRARPVPQSRCPGRGRAARTDALQPGQAGEAGAVLADDAPQPRLVERRVRDAGPVQRDQRLEVGGRQVAERRAPVQDRGRTGRGGREHEAHARPRQVDRCEGHAANDARRISPSRRRTSVRGRSTAAGVKNTSIGTASR